MMRAVASSLGLFLLFNTAVIQAQPTPADLAEEEAVRRQEAIRLLRMKLTEGQNFQRQTRLVEAANSYEAAYALFPRVGLAGANVESDKAAVVDGLVTVRLQLAEQARRRGDLQGAETQLKSALRVNPQSAQALKMKLEVDKAIAASRGMVPSAETVARVPEIQQQKITAGTLVQDGKLLYEAGRIGEAEVKLKQALQLEPDHRAATYYLELIRENRFSRQVRDRNLTSGDAMVEVKAAWNPDNRRDQLPFPNPVLQQKDVVHTSPQRQEISAKLNAIRLNEVGYDGLPLIEVLKHLTDESIKRDPDKLGLNFMVNPHADAPASTAPTVPTDPTAPPVIIEQTAPAVDITTVTVKLSPPLRNLRLADVLDAVITSADQPIRYEIRDYAIVFSPRTPEATPLHVRTWKVDPNTFQQGLESVNTLSLGSQINTEGGGGGGGGGSSEQDGTFSIPRVTLGQIISGSGGGGGGTGNREGTGLNFVTKTNTLRTVNDLVREYFTTTGVELNPPKSVFFNDRSGDLIVRATLQDLEIIEIAVQRLNTPPPQVTIESKFAEIGQEDSKALGFDWYLGNTLLGGGRIGAQTGSAPSYAGRPSTANPSGIFPGPGFGNGIIGPGTILPSSSDNLLTTGLRNTFGASSATIPEVGTITGILTDPQFRAVIRALDQRTGADVLSAPKVTTLSGRQAQISVLDLRTIVTDVEVENNQTTAPAGGTGSTIIQNSLPSIEYTLSLIPTGPVLDVIPYVSADGYSIQMTLIPTLTEFLGYEDPGDFATIATTGSGAGASISATLPLPRMRVRQITTSCIVYDGQTIVLGGLISENLRKIKDKVPMLGDIPYVGRLFRSESSSSDKRNLVVFVTPTIVDPSGRRVHADEDLPFARTSIPAQPAPVQQ